MISPDQLAAYLDNALDDPAREAVERQLEHDAEALRFVLEQRRLDRVLGSVLAPAARRQRLKASVLAAIAAPSTEQLRAQVLADTSGRDVRPAQRTPRSVGWWEAGRAWLDGVGARLLSPGWARYAVATTLLLMAVGGWLLFRPAAETRIVATMNFAAWSHFLWLRAVDKAAQWEIRIMGQAVLRMLYVLAPAVFCGRVASF